MLHEKNHEECPDCGVKTSEEGFSYDMQFCTACRWNCPYSYTCGFLFDDRLSRVALIRKLTPLWQRGLLNGIGGKIETGEDPFTCQAREFREETGVGLKEWNLFQIEHFESKVTVHFFYAIDTTALECVTTKTDEQVGIYPLQTLHLESVISNLLYLIPMALTKYGKIPINYLPVLR